MKSSVPPFTRLLLTPPPMLEGALGYAGEAPFVAFYWNGDELAWSDGRHHICGAHWPAWLLFLHHDAVAPCLGGFDFGSPEERAQHWLLLDRERRALYAGEAAAVTAYLNAPSSERATINTDPGALRAAINRWDTEIGTRQAIQDIVECHERLDVALRNWLDACSNRHSRKK